jgi:hypothetical protein
MIDDDRNDLRGLQRAMEVGVSWRIQKQKVRVQLGRVQRNLENNVYCILLLLASFIPNFCWRNRL